jgi:hypothetical protein
MSLTLDQVGKTVSFRLIPEAVISDNFTDVILEGITTWDQVKYIDPAVKHQLVYPTLPEGTPNDYRGYLYAIIRPAVGDVTAVGLPWIDPLSVKTVSKTDIIITISGSGVSDIDDIRALLSSRNYTVSNIVTKSL